MFLRKFNRQTLFHIQNKIIKTMAGDKINISRKKTFTDVSYFSTCQQYVLSVLLFVADSIHDFQYCHLQWATYYNFEETQIYNLLNQQMYVISRKYVDI